MVGLLVLFTTWSVRVLPGNIWLELLRGEAGVGAELARHPNLGAITETTFHFVPEHALLEGLLDGVSCRRLPEEIDLVGLILHGHLMLVIFKIVVKRLGVIIVNSNRSLHRQIDEFSHIFKLVGLLADPIDRRIDLWLPQGGLFLGLLKMLRVQISILGLLRDRTEVHVGVGVRRFIPGQICGVGIHARP